MATRSKSVVHLHRWQFDSDDAFSAAQQEARALALLEHRQKRGRKKKCQVSFVLAEQVAIASLCAILLASPRLLVPGYKDSNRLEGQRIAQLLLMICSNFVYCFLAWSVPKRQTLLTAVVASAAQFLLVCDTIWSCRYVSFGCRVVGFVAMVQMITVKRKLLARVNGLTGLQQLAPVHKGLMAIFFVNATVALVLPGFVIFRVFEACMWVFVASNAGLYFSKFMVASAKIATESKSAAKKASMCGKRPSSLNRTRVSRDAGYTKLAQKRLKLNLILSFTGIVIAVFVAILYAIFRLPKTCQERSSDDTVTSTLEYVTSYTKDLLLVMTIIVSLHTSVIFTAAKRRKRKDHLRRRFSLINGSYPSKFGS